MRRNAFLACLAISAVVSVVCPTVRAQSVADAARAAKEAKDAKKKRPTDTTDSTAAKPKVYTNDEIPEARGSRATVSDQAQASKLPDSAAAAPASSAGPAKTPPDQHPYEWGPDSGHVDFKFTSSSVKRPGTAKTQWMVQNTSNHVEEVALKTVITGPCGYHQDTDSVHKLNSGGGYTDTMQVQLVPLASDCAGTYRVELRFIVDGKVLDSASDSITVE